MIGADALYLLYAWLLSAIVASYLSERKGYGEKAGLACGLLLFVIGPVIWLLWPARPTPSGSVWDRSGAAAPGARTSATPEAPQTLSAIPSFAEEWPPSSAVPRLALSAARRAARRRGPGARSGGLASAHAPVWR